MVSKDGNKEEQRQRLFFAICPPAEIRQTLSELAAGIQKEWGGRQIPLENIHLTLLFLGAVPETKLPAVLSAVDSVKGESFGLTLDHLAFWAKQKMLLAMPTKTPAVLAELNTNLLEVISARCGLAIEAKPFLPHITLLRKVGRQPVNALLSKLTWGVHEFCLLESVPVQGGVVYKILQRWGLR